MVISGKPGDCSDSGVSNDKCNLKWQVRERGSFRYNGKEDALLKVERQSKNSKLGDNGTGAGQK